MDSAGLQLFLALPDAELRRYSFALLSARHQGVVRPFSGLSAFLDAAPQSGGRADDTAAGVLVAAIDSEGAAGCDTPALLGHAMRSRPGVVALAVAERVTTTDLAPLLRAGLGGLVTAGAPGAVARDIADLAPALLARAGALAQQRAARDQLSQLTGREADVLAAIAAGETSKESGRRLGISPRTVEVHRASLMRRLDASSTAALLHLHFLASLDAKSALWAPASAPPSWLPDDAVGADAGPAASRVAARAMAPGRTAARVAVAAVRARSAALRQAGSRD